MDRAKKRILRLLKDGSMPHSMIFDGAAEHVADAMQELLDDGTVSRKTEYVYSIEEQD